MIKHEITRIDGKGSDPHNYSGWIQPVCSCGWEGRKEYNYSNVQHSNLREEEQKHLKECGQ